jgi:DNA-binding PucR family transcriptional regulator
MSLEEPAGGRADHIADPAPSVPGQRDVAAVDLHAWLAAVGEVAREANWNASIGRLVSRITATCCQLLGYEFCLIMLVDRCRQRLIVKGGCGLSADYIARYNAERPVLLGPGLHGEGPSSRAFRTARPVTVPDIRLDPLFGPLDGVPPLDAPYRALLSVPLVTREGAIGVINCYTAEPREVSADEIALVEILADQAAIAFEVAGLRARERATIEDLERQRELLERAEETHRHLTRVVLESEGFAGIARALARLLDSPVLIADAAGQPLAFSGLRVSSEPTPDVICSDEAVVARLSEPQAIRQVVELEAPGGAAFWVAPILVGQELGGRVWAGPVEGSPGLLERRALEHGATVAALELLKHRAAQEVEWRVRRDLLVDLLTDPIADESALRARAQHLGHDLSRPQAVLVVRQDAAPADDADAERTTANHGPAHRLLDVVGRGVARLGGPKPLIARHREQVVVLWPLGDGGDSPGARELAQLILRSARWSGQTVLVALGPPAERLTDIGSAYRIARGALNLARQAGRRDQTVMLDQLDVYGLILQVERPAALERFARTLFEPLEAYDRQRGSELVASLRAYLDHRFSVGDSAAALVVHPHTLAYRLRRVEQLLGLSLRQPDSLLRVQLAFMIRDIIGP